jgi:hypothetical protein
LIKVKQNVVFVTRAQGRGIAHTLLLERNFPENDETVFSNMGVPFN